MTLGDAEEGTGGAFGLAVALFPVLERARTDVDERGKLGLAEPKFLADHPRISRALFWTRGGSRAKLRA